MVKDRRSSSSSSSPANVKDRLSSPDEERKGDLAIEGKVEATAEVIPNGSLDGMGDERFVHEL